MKRGIGGEGDWDDVRYFNVGFVPRLEGVNMLIVKTSLLTLAASVLFATAVNAQNDSSRRYPISFFGEIAGTSFGAISFHVDAQVYRVAPIDLSIRLSTGFPFIASYFYWPVSIQNVFFEGDDHLEIGGGIGHLVQLSTRNQNDGLIDPVNQYKFANLGYRLEPPEGGTVFRIYGMWHTWSAHGESNFWIGISIGTTI